MNDDSIHFALSIALGLPGGTKSDTLCNEPASWISLYATLIDLSGLSEVPSNDGRRPIPIP